MAEEWQTTTDLETLLVGAIDAADPEGYFRVLAGADLVVPLPPETAEQVLADNVQPVWPTQEVDGRTHVLAYTSPEAMRAHLGPHLQHHLRLKLTDMAAAWPHPHWWLAVDLSLPPQALLPSWFLRQLADGDPRPVLLGLPRPAGPAAPPRPVPVPPPVAAEPGAAEPVTPDSPAVQSALAAVQESGSLQDANRHAAEVLAALRGFSSPAQASAPADVPAALSHPPAGQDVPHASGPAAPERASRHGAPEPAVSAEQAPPVGDAPGASAEQRAPQADGPGTGSPASGLPSPTVVPGVPGMPAEPGIPRTGAPHSFASAEQTPPGVPAEQGAPYTGPTQPTGFPDPAPRAGGIPGPVAPATPPGQSGPYQGTPRTPLSAQGTPQASDSHEHAAPAAPEAPAERTGRHSAPQAADAPGRSPAGTVAPGMPGAPRHEAPQTSGQGAPSVAKHGAPSVEAPQHVPEHPSSPEDVVPGTPTEQDGPQTASEQTPLPGPVAPGMPAEQDGPYTATRQTGSPSEQAPLIGAAPPGAPVGQGVPQPADSSDRAPLAVPPVPDVPGAPAVQEGPLPGAPQTAEHAPPAGTVSPDAPVGQGTSPTVPSESAPPAGAALPGAPIGPGAPQTVASSEHVPPAGAVPPGMLAEQEAPHTGAARAGVSPEQESSAGAVTPGADPEHGAPLAGEPRTAEHTPSAEGTTPEIPTEQGSPSAETSQTTGSPEPTAPGAPAEQGDPYSGAPQAVGSPEQTPPAPGTPAGPGAPQTIAASGQTPPVPGAASEREEPYAGGLNSSDAPEPTSSVADVPVVPEAVAEREGARNEVPEPGSPERAEGPVDDGQGVPQGAGSLPGVPVAPTGGAGRDLPNSVAALLGRQESDRHGSVPEGAPDEEDRVFGSAEHARGPVGGDDPTQTQIDGLPPIVDELRSGSAAEAERAVAAPGRGRFLPANPVETELVRAADEESLVKALMGADLLLPVPPGTDASARPSRPGFPWQPGEIDGTPAVPAFTSPERLLDVIGQVDYVRVPFPTVVRHWPDLGWTLAINPGTPASATLTGQQLPLVATWVDQLVTERPDSFSPQNELEQRLYEAAQRRDAETFFGLLTSAQVMIPADPDTPWGAQPGEPDFPWHPVPIKGEQSIMAFTSPRWMHEAVGQSRFVMPDFRELAANWPEHGWSLVLNPGTPIDLTVPGDRLRAAVAPAEPQRARPVHFEPGNRVDQDLDEAVLAGDSDDFLRVTLAAEVLVPVPATAPEDLSPEHPDFDWSAALSASPPGPGASVRVFTSHLRLQETVGDVRYVTVGFTELISHWRRTDWTLHLNPGTRIGASLDGGQVRELSDWAVSVGLPVRQGQHRELAQPYAAPHAPAEADASPETTSAENPVVDVPAPRERAPQVTVMQKVLPHGHVGWYLEQGYDRVGGFIHPLADCAELTTPAQLYEALGLLYRDSPFDLADEAVHVLRWHAHCEDLYRVPFGGHTEEDLQAWGDAGWVLEQEPFEGTGFAPGSAGSIREFKSDSTRLPTGAQLYLVGRDRTEALVAVYDADVLSWTPAQQPKEVPQ